MGSSEIKVFDITGAPNDEVDDIRNLLDRNGVPYYETPRANFGISVAAIWVRNEKEYKKARALIDEYQKDRLIKVRAASARSKKNIIWWKRKEIPFFIFIILLLVWMVFAGVWRP